MVPLQHHLQAACSWRAESGLSGVSVVHRGTWMNTVHQVNGARLVWGRKKQGCKTLVSLLENRNTQTVIRTVHTC